MTRLCLAMVLRAAVRMPVGSCVVSVSLAGSLVVRMVALDVSERLGVGAVAGAGLAYLLGVGLQGQVRR